MQSFFLKSFLSITWNPVHRAFLSIPVCNSQDSGRILLFHNDFIVLWHSFPELWPVANTHLFHLCPRGQKKITSNNIHVQTTSRAPLPSEKSIHFVEEKKKTKQPTTPNFGHLKVNSFPKQPRLKTRCASLRWNTTVHLKTPPQVPSVKSLAHSHFSITTAFRAAKWGLGW